MKKQAAQEGALKAGTGRKGAPRPHRAATAGVGKSTKAQGASIEKKSSQALQVRLPQSVHGRAKERARAEGVSLNQFLVTAASNEIVRQETREFFAHASKGYDAQAFADALAAVPDVPPVPGDEL